MSGHRASQALSWSASALVSTAVAILSASKLVTVARAAGWSSGIAPLIFLAIDGAGFAGGLTAFYGMTKSARNYGWFVLCESTGLSLAGNEAADWVHLHGYLPTWMGALVTAAVPLQLPLTVHQTMLLAQGSTAGRSAPSVRADVRPSIDPTDQIGQRRSVDPISDPRSTLCDAGLDTDRLPLRDPEFPSAGEPSVGSRLPGDRAATLDPHRPDSATDRPTDQEESSAGRHRIDRYSAPDPSTTRAPRSRSIDELRVDLAQAIARGAIDAQPTAEAIRKLLSIAPDRARTLRDELRHRRESIDHPRNLPLHAIPIDRSDEAAG